MAACRAPSHALPAGSSAGLLESLSGFVKELRTAGIPVSLTENLDAMEALRTSPSRTARRSSTPWPPPW